MLLNSIKAAKPEVKGIITCGSVHSPQSPIVAKVCSDNHVPCIIGIGGNITNLSKTIQTHKSLEVSKKVGAEIRVVSKLGYDKTMMPFVELIAKELNYEIIKFGINLNEYPSAIIDAIANQVQNIPDHLNNLIVPCGSGITFAGILVGIKRFNKKIDNIFVIQISGYDRTKSINEILHKFGIEARYKFFIDYIYEYTKKCRISIASGFDLSVIYEAKAFQYFTNNKSILGIKDTDKSLFWVIGNNNFLYV